MASLSDEDDEIPLLLIRPAAPRPQASAIETQFWEEPAFQAADDEDDDAAVPVVAERFTPGVAGAALGLVAGPIGFGVVHALSLTVLDRELASAAARWELTTTLTTAIAYVTASAWGAIVGGCFGHVTRYLRRFFPLLLWSVIFFVSFGMVVVAAIAPKLGGARTPSALAILAGIAAFAFVVPFELPIRRRGTSAD